MAWYKGILPLLLVLIQWGGFSYETSMVLESPHPIYDREISFEKVIDPDFKAMIVPHHLVPMDLLLDTYAKAYNPNVKQVILLSPDHFTNSSRQVLTSKKDWVGPFGLLKTNRIWTDSFLQKDYIFEDDEEILTEHGLNGHIPLIKMFFPRAQITCLAISKQTMKRDLDALINDLPEDAFIIASVDFSHYYSKAEADAYDAYTKKIIEGGNYHMFFGLSDAYFDSPGVLYVIFQWARLKGYNYEILDQGNSADYYGIHLNETTSYFTIKFCK